MTIDWDWSSARRPMLSRYSSMISLLLALVLGPTPFSDIDEWLIPNPWAIASDSVPDEAARALEQGRYWRASKILRSYLATVPDTAPESILMIAKTDAGWGDWTGVEKLLAGRSWLDTAESGAGWEIGRASWRGRGGVGGGA